MARRAGGIQQAAGGHDTDSSSQTLGFAATLHCDHARKVYRRGRAAARTSKLWYSIRTRLSTLHPYPVVATAGITRFTTASGQPFPPVTRPLREAKMETSGSAASRASYCYVNSSSPPVRCLVTNCSAAWRSTVVEACKRLGGFGGRDHFDSGWAFGGVAATLRGGAGRASLLEKATCGPFAAARCGEAICNAASQLKFFPPKCHAWVELIITLSPARLSSSLPDSACVTETGRTSKKNGCTKRAESENAMFRLA